MRGVSLVTLRTRVSRAADIEGASARFPDSELNDYINESLAELYELIRASFGQDYYRKTYSFQTTGNLAGGYPLPPDFMSVISVDVPLGGNLVLTCRPYMENERNRYKFFPFGAWTMHQPIWYRLTGAADSTGNSPQTISFTPNPTGSYQVNVNYCPILTKLVRDSDTFDGIAGWDLYVVWDAAMKCAMKDQDYDLLNALQAQKMAVMARIQTMASEHDGGQAERVHDVYRDSEDYWW